MWDRIHDGWEQLARLGTHLLGRGRVDDDGDAAVVPVVLIGGLATTDAAMVPLRSALEDLGHPVHTITTGAGLGCAARGAEEVTACVRECAARWGEPVALVGYSRGGQYARVAARRAPAHVAAVVTLGTPLTRLTWPMLAFTGVLGALGTLGVPGLASAGCLVGSCLEGFDGEVAGPWSREVPLTAVRARDDAAVPPDSSADPHAHEVEVDGGHLGLLTSAAARDAVVTALFAAGSDRPPAWRYPSNRTTSRASRWGTEKGLSQVESSAGPTGRASVSTA